MNDEGRPPVDLMVLGLDWPRVNPAARGASLLRRRHPAKQVAHEQRLIVRANDCQRLVQCSDKSVDLGLADHDRRLNPEDVGQRSQNADPMVTQQKAREQDRQETLATRNTKERRLA